MTGARRLEPALRRADLGDPGRARRRGRAGARSTSRWPGSPTPTARCAARPPRRSPRRSSPGCAPAPTSSTRCSRTSRSRTACAPTRTGSPPGTSPTRPPTSRSQALVEAVKGRYELARRWYRTKAKLLGIERLADYDRMARGRRRRRGDRLGRRAARWSLDSFASLLRPRPREVVERFFDERWIDAPPRPGQARRRLQRLDGALGPPLRDAQLHRPAPRRAHPRPRARPRPAPDARPRAGHLPPGHAADRRRDGLGLRRGDRLRPAARAPPTDPARASALLAEAVEGQIATVFRQIAMNQFEDRGPHRAARARASSRSSASASSGPRPRTELLGDSVEVTDGYRSWWSYVPHFIGSPGYVYAYAFGQLLALSVYRLYTERGDEIVPAYLEMLARRRLALARGARQDRRRRPHRPRLLGLRPRPRRRAGRAGERGGRRGHERDLERLLSRSGYCRWSFTCKRTVERGADVSRNHPADAGGVQHRDL